MKLTPPPEIIELLSLVDDYVWERYSASSIDPSSCPPPSGLLFPGCFTGRSGAHEEPRLSPWELRDAFAYSLMFEAGVCFSRSFGRSSAMCSRVVRSGGEEASLTIWQHSGLGKRLPGGIRETLRCAFVVEDIQSDGPKLERLEEDPLCLALEHLLAAPIDGLLFVTMEQLEPGALAFLTERLSLFLESLRAEAMDEDDEVPDSRLIIHLLALEERVAFSCHAPSALRSPMDAFFSPDRGLRTQADLIEAGWSVYPELPEEDRQLCLDMNLGDPEEGIPF